MAILTVAQLREHVTTPLVDAALQRLLDAAERDIVLTAGASGSAVETHDSETEFIYPSRPVSAVTSITETLGVTVTTLAANDYIVWSGGWVIERLATGTNPRGGWTGTVTLTSTGPADTAVRQMVQVALVKLDLAYEGVLSQQVGDWQMSFGAESYSVRRAQILDALRGTGVVFA